MEKNRNQKIDLIYRNLRADNIFIIDLLEHLNKNFHYDGRNYYFKEEGLGMYAMPAESVIKDFIITKFNI